MVLLWVSSHCVAREMCNVHSTIIEIDVGSFSRILNLQSFSESYCKWMSDVAWILFSCLIFCQVHCQFLFSVECSLVLFGCCNTTATPLCLSLSIFSGVNQSAWWLNCDVNIFIFDDCHSKWMYRNLTELSYLKVVKWIFLNLLMLSTKREYKCSARFMNYYKIVKFVTRCMYI